MDEHQAMLQQEEQMAAQQILQTVPTAAEPLEPERVQAFAEAVSRANVTLAQGAPLPELAVNEAVEQLPDELAITAASIFAFFESGQVPETKPYAKDFVTLVQTNDGLLQLSAALHRASGDRALVAALQEPMPQEGPRENAPTPNLRHRIESLPAEARDPMQMGVIEELMAQGDTAAVEEILSSLEQGGPGEPTRRRRGASASN